MKRQAFACKTGRQREREAHGNDTEIAERVRETEGKGGKELHGKRTMVKEKNNTWKGFRVV